MDLDLSDCFGRKKTPSYNRRNTVLMNNIVTEHTVAEPVCLPLHRQAVWKTGHRSLYSYAEKNSQVGQESKIFRFVVNYFF